MKELDDLVIYLLQQNKDEAISTSETRIALKKIRSSDTHMDLLLQKPLREAREAFERIYFEQLLRIVGGNISKLAARAGMERTHLYRKLKSLGINPTVRKKNIMKVIVLGANHLGIALALNLAQENNDVTLVDKDFRLFQDIQSVFDLRTIIGQGSHPEVLEQADAEDADMLIALNDRDEENIIACRIAHTIFDIPTKIAKVTTRGYLEEKK